MTAIFKHHRADEAEQISSWENGTLQGGEINKTVVTILTHVDIPARIDIQGPTAVAAFVQLEIERGNALYEIVVGLAER